MEGATQHTGCVTQQFTVAAYPTLLALYQVYEYCALDSKRSTTIVRATSAKCLPQHGRSFPHVQQCFVYYHPDIYALAASFHKTYGRRFLGFQPIQVRGRFAAHSPSAISYAGTRRGVSYARAGTVVNLLNEISRANAK